MRFPMSKWLLGRWVVGLSALALLLSPAVANVNALTEVENAASSGNGSFGAISDGTPASSVQLEPYYYERLQQWREQGMEDATQDIKIRAADYSAKSPNAEITIETYSGKNDVLHWRSNALSWIEYAVYAPQAGLYEMEIAYHPIVGDGLNRDVALALKINGVLPFREASALNLERIWRDRLPLAVDGQGDQIRPLPLQIDQWTVKALKDSEGAYSAPLRWQLNEGANLIRVEASEPVALEFIRLKPPLSLPTYEEFASAAPVTYGQTKEVQIIEAEMMSSKTASAIRMETDQDPLTSPRAYGKTLFNFIDGWSWWRGGQAATWEFEVPESGRYELAFRVNQQHYSNKATFRTIKLDGEVPHEGLLEYRFPYERGWYGLTLGSGKDTPYEFYLEKGTHTLTMEVTHGPVKPLIIELERLIDLVRAMDQDLQILTGGQVDKSRTWKESELPGLREQLAEALQMSEELRAGMLEINGKRDDVVTGLESAIRDFQKFLKYPAEVPNRLDELAVLMDKISSFHLMLVQQPLGLDQIYIVPVGAELPRTKASFLQSLDGAVQTFFHSFVRKDDISELDDNKLNVWVMRGRDYVNLLQELADELFTPVTGVEVKVNLITDENLLVLANAAGIQPDVALGLAQNRPFDYALRNAIVDLTEFADFEEVASHYAPGAILSYFYDGGYYALPETQSFNVLFYRKDILEQLGLEVPETWDDVYEMLPTLQQNHRNFHVNRTDFLPFIYQNGAEFFKADGTGILLDSPEAFAGFKQWTDLYSIYGVKQEVPSFYQHFRRGTLPIGIADYNMFVQLTASAPELYGRWGIAPIPGKAQPDGTIARWASGGQNAAVIYKKTEKKEAAWQFMKWWLSAEVQERYGGDLEAFNGPEFRWNTANVEAFVRLPWKADEARVILEQWKWFKEMPNLPGSYFVDREMNNGWNRTVVDHANYRTSLEKSITEIDREMLRKRQEFGFVDDNGDTLKTLDLPQVTTPWEGVDQFVPNGSVSPAN